jgi:diguanylate cyclase (GGDEF)-like protein
VKAALEAGAFDYVKKPLDDIEIVARVRSALRYKAHQDRLTEMAMHDSLTGLYNHRLLIELLERELATGRRKAQPVSFCMADIDHFKVLNDRYGHQAGDQVLQEVSRLLIQGLRKSDPVGRYGGEEFGIVLGGCSPDKAEALCERLRQVIETHPFVVLGQSVTVTVSLGLAHADPEEDVSETDLVRRADLALYKAKEQGRNRLVS